MQPLPKAVIQELHRAALAIDMAPVREALTHVVRKIRLTGPILSDRKLVKAQKLIAAAALLRGASAAGEEDLWPVTYLVQSQSQQQDIRELLQTELQQSRNPVLSHSVAAATYGPTAHAARLAEEAAVLLETRPALDTDPLHERWLVRLETMQMRIDAAFDAKALPQQLGAVRASIDALLITPTRGVAAATETAG